MKKWRRDDVGMKMVFRTFNGKNGQLEAMCLAELLIASLIASILLLGLSSFILLPITIMHHANDDHAAQTRAEMVFAIIRTPLEHCGYGTPKNPDDFKKALGSSGAPFNWKGPISVGTGPVSAWPMTDGLCKIIYAARTSIRTLAEVVTSSDTVELQASGVPGLTVTSTTPARPDSVKNLIVFGAMSPLRPMWEYKSPQKLLDSSAVISLRWNKLTGDETVFIPENDELYYFRAMECGIRISGGENVFCSNDYTGSGWQPRVDGVLDVRFELDDGGRLLRVTVLTRGNKRYDRIVTEGIPDGWPEKYAPAISEESRHYRLLVNKASFELKNF